MAESIYHSRNPRSSQYYCCVEDYFEIFEQDYEDRFERRYGFFRPYVKQVIYRFARPFRPPLIRKPWNKFSAIRY